MEEPEVFGTASGPDLTAEKIAEITAARDKHFADIVAICHAAKAAADRFGLRVDRPTGRVSSNARHETASSDVNA